MPILRSAKEKRDRTWGLAFSWRRKTSSLTSLLGAIIIASCLFGFAAYSLKVTLVNAPSKRPMAAPLLMLDTSLRSNSSIREHHADQEHSMLTTLNEKVLSLTRVIDKKSLPLAELPETFGGAQIKLPTLIRPGTTYMPPLKPKELTPIPSTKKFVTYLLLHNTKNAAAPILSSPQPLALENEAFIPFIDTSITALITTNKRGQMISSFIIDSPTRDIEILAAKYLKGLAFHPGEAATFSIQLIISTP